MTLAVAGDVMLARDVAPYYPYVAEALRTLRETLGVSAFVANLESPVCHASLLEGRKFRADPSDCGDVLKLFDVLSVANNHSLDCGIEGFIETVYVLRSLGVTPVGYRPQGRLQEPARLQCDGYKVSIIGLLDQELLPEAVGTCIATCDDLDTVQREVINAREAADFVICLLHAGDEMVSFPLEREKELPRFLSANGVDIVVRSGSHTLQGYETEGLRLILYSLGDFIFDGPARRRRTAGLATLKFTSTGVQFRPYRVQHDKHRSPHLTMRQPFRYPNLPVWCQDLRRSLDYAVYYFERAEHVFATEGISNGIREVASRLWHREYLPRKYGR